MRIDVLTLFPAMVDAPLRESIVARARASGALDLHLHDIRTWTDDVHRTVDDTPYGGGAGMVMKVDPLVRGVEDIWAQSGSRGQVLIMSAAGIPFNQSMARAWSQDDHLILICGHYEGIDDRVRILLDATELSIGDYVLTGGELAAAVVIDAIARLLPGVIKDESIAQESHEPGHGGLLEFPHYTRPAVYRDLAVPDVLMSGNHAEIARWRQEQAVAKTRTNRPDIASAQDDRDQSKTLGGKSRLL
ncbi:MAG TPA: tRNA (guanosine(37)-N1)-methyltransferase TrmD [Thermomicrobiales bacterium]|nr:tRNA (guanosine(37)-N1)-methyltransferase TrmD [Thermomicrobiales bacterium]